MMLTEAAAQAKKEITHIFDVLLSEVETRKAMQNLGEAFERLVEALNLEQADQQQVAAVLTVAATYLHEAAGRTELDSRLLLHCVSGQCWEKYNQCDVPEAVIEAFDLRQGEGQAMAQALSKGIELGCSRETAELLAWWIAASLVSEAAHLEEGQVEDAFWPLLQEFEQGQAKPPRPISN